MDIYDIFQNFRIREAHSTAVDTKYENKDQNISISSLQDQIDYLSVVTLAMCELLEEVGFNKSMLQSKIEEIDLRDGKLDGKTTKTSNCSNCNRIVANRHTKCIYCGELLTKQSVL